LISDLIVPEIKMRQRWRSGTAPALLHRAVTTVIYNEL
jgi:hypothetical protein